MNPYPSRPGSIADAALNPRTSDLALTFGEVAQKVAATFHWSAIVLLVLVGAGYAVVAYTNPSWQMAYAAISVPAVLAVRAWSKTTIKGMPLVTMLIVQHLFIYAIPLVVENKTIFRTRDDIITTSGWIVMAFLISLVLGRAMGCTKGSITNGSNWNLGLADAIDSGKKASNIAFLLLGVALAFQVSNRTGLTFKILPPSLYAAYSVIRSLAHSATMLGGFLGGVLAGGRHLGPGLRLMFWLLITVNTLLSVADVLISAASGIVIAVTMGLLFGARRVPWVFLIIAFSVIGFLNQGKFVMRAKYWNENAGTAGRTFNQLPAFFIEWSQASTAYLFGKRQGAVGGAEVEAGQSILERINNLQNLTFVVDALKHGRRGPLEGDTYTLIPKLLVPRFLWPDKPRAHQGQVLLNLHFGRQADVEATEKTYIAWGLLPEAVGNFGPAWGPIIVGLLLGFFLGKLEAWSVQTRLFSVEGVVMIVLFLMVTASYEMVASVLVTAAFQSSVSSAGGALLLYLWFGGSRDQPAQRLPAAPVRPEIIRGSKRHNVRY